MNAAHEISQDELDGALFMCAVELRAAGYGQNGLEYFFQGEGRMPINTPQLHALVEARGLSSLVVQPVKDGGFQIIVNDDIPVCTQRGKVKVFSTADSVVRYLQRANVTRFIFEIGEQK